MEEPRPGEQQADVLPGNSLLRSLLVSSQALLAHPPSPNLRHGHMWMSDRAGDRNNRVGTMPGMEESQNGDTGQGATPEPAPACDSLSHSASLCPRGPSHPPGPAQSSSSLCPHRTVERRALTSCLSLAQSKNVLRFMILGMCMGVVPECVSVNYTCACCLQRSEHPIP